MQKTLPHYDWIIVPGMQLTAAWELRDDMKVLLHKVAAVHSRNPNSKVIVSGKWSIWYDWMDITPPVTEAFMMKQYLVSKGVPAKLIVMENKAKDSLGNAYYSKCHIRNKSGKNILIFSASQHQERLKFLFHKFFGENYHLDYAGLPSSHFKQYEVVTDTVLTVQDRPEHEVFAEQRELLKSVRPGREEDFSHQLYKCRYYAHNPSKHMLAALV